MTPVDTTRSALQNALKTFRVARKDLRANDLAALFDDAEALFVEFSQAMSEEKLPAPPAVPDIVVDEKPAEDSPPAPTGAAS